MQMYEDGDKSFRDIGAALGISHVAAAKLYHKADAERRAESKEKAMSIAARIEARAELIVLANEHRALDPDDEQSIAAGKLVLAANEQLAKLHGLYVSKTELTGANGGALKTENTTVHYDGDLSQLTDDELAQVLAIRTRLGGSHSQDANGD